MASTYSPLLRLELIGSGEQSGLWGETTNKNLGTLLEQAIAGVTTISLSGGAGVFTLTTLNGTQDQARSAVLKFIGNPSGEKIIEIPSVEKLYVVRNETSTSQKLIFRTAAQISNPTLGGVEVLGGEATLVFCDGSQAKAGIQTASVGTLTVPGGGTGATSFTGGFVKSPGGTGSLTSSATINAATEVSGTLATSNGGTGRNTITAGRILVGDGTNPVGLLGGSTPGQLATWDGTQWVAQTPAAQSTFVTGMIMLWAGLVSTIPAGWALCNGANGTPDLQNRFVVGAGDAYVVNATGGASSVTLSASNLPSHTHTVSVSGSTTPADASHSHTLSGSTGNADISHSHTVSGSTGGQDQNATHKHRIIASTSGAGAHSHTVLSGLSNNAGGSAGVTDMGTATTATTTSAPNHTHNIDVDSGTASTDHSHTVSGTAAATSVPHSHSLAGLTTVAASASHSHTYSFNGTSGPTGTGTAFDNRPPYYALAYIMKL